MTDVPTPSDPPSRPSLASKPSPAWIWALAGWLLAASELDRRASGPTEAEIRSRIPAGALGELDGHPDTMSVRALRRLPAVGPTRAVAIARERWERGVAGGPEAWDTIRGIGPGTVASIRRALDRSRAAGSAVGDSTESATP